MCTLKLEETKEVIPSLCRKKQISLISIQTRLRIEVWWFLTQFCRLILSSSLPLLLWGHMFLGQDPSNLKVLWIYCDHFLFHSASDETSTRSLNARGTGPPGPRPQRSHLLHRPSAGLVLQAGNALTDTLWSVLREELRDRAVVTSDN